MTQKRGMPFTFRDLPADSFPFVIEFFRAADTEGIVAVHRIEVTGPGAVQIPGLAGGGVPVWVRLTFANGQVVEDRSGTTKGGTGP